MQSRLAVVCSLLVAATATSFAQDWFEPNPSLARLSADDAYARTSARSLRTAGIGTAVALRLDDANRVVVVGTSDAGAPRIARLDASGRLDPTFGIAGVAELPVWGTPRSLEIDAAGRIVVTGRFGDSASILWDPAYAGGVYGAARLAADGSLDPAFSSDGLVEDNAFDGPVHAVGGDGAMLAAAGNSLVRIAADGTIDAAYGHAGATQVVRGWSADDVFWVADFAVESAGSAVVAVRAGDARFSFPVQRLDARGDIDPAALDGFGRTQSGGSAPTQIDLDGAGRLVGLDYPHLWRRLADGSPDSTFADDGRAWHLATGARRAGNNPLVNVNVKDSAELLQDLAVLASHMSMDPDFDGEPLGGREFLAVAARADRWALARDVVFRDAGRRVVGRGVAVQAIDPNDPGAIVSANYRLPDHAFPDRLFGRVDGLAIAPDGSAAYALGGAIVVRVDLAARKEHPLPDLRVNWIGAPHAIDFSGGHYRVTALVRIRNVSKRDATVVGDVTIGDGEIGDASFAGPIHPLVPIHGSDTSSRLVTVRARSSIVRRFTWEGTYGPAALAGARLSVRVRSELPDANPADNTATSRTFAPLYVGKR